MMAKRWMLFVMVMMGVLLALTGCEQQGQDSQSHNPPTNQADKQGANATQPVTSAPLSELIAVQVYFSTHDAMYLVAETRQVSKDEAAKAALEQLIAGPHDKNLRNPLPAATRVKDVSVKNHIATVNFNEAFRKDNHGGSTGETLAVGAVVNTLTAIPHIEKVRFAIEGKLIDTLKGHLDLDEPVGRMDELIKK